MRDQTFDPIWDAKYAAGEVQRYPWDSVVSFVFQNAPRNRPRNEITILEIGCGTGSNLWFAAREGFSVSGIDAAAAAIEFAQRRFEADHLVGDFRVGDFTQLPFDDSMFDLVIDRGAIVCVGHSAGRQTVREVRRVLKTGGKFFFNPLSDRHSSSSSGVQGPDRLRVNIDQGRVVGVGQLCFYGRSDVECALEDGWTIRSLTHVEWLELLEPAVWIHAEWRVVAENNKGRR